jgi:putative ABC transport system permease protein
MLLFRLLSFRSLRVHLIRTALSTFGIILGVASILAIGVTNGAALDSVSKLFQDTAGRANLTVISADSSGKGLPESALRKVAGLPGVEIAVPSLQGQAMLQDEAASTSLGLSFFGAGIEGGMALYGIDLQKDPAIRSYKLVAGRLLGGDSADEIVLVQEFASEKKLRLGDWVKLLTPTGPQRLRLCGLIAREGAGQVNNGAIGFLSLELAQKVFDRRGAIDRIDIVARPEVNSVDALDNLKSALADRLGKAFSVVYPASQGKRMAQQLSSYQIGLNFMSGMALFIGIFLIYNTFSMRVIERTREFGMFRTIGMTRRQVTALVLAEAGLLGLIGSALGMGLGLFLSLGLARLMAVFIGQNLSITRIPLDVLVTSIAVGILATLLAATLPAIQAGRISPLEALRVRGVQRAGWLIRRGWLFGLALFLVSAILLVWNPFAYDVQFRLGSVTVFGLFVGGALMVPGSIGVWNRLTRPVFARLYGSAGRLGAGNVERARLRTTLTVAALMMGVAMTVIVRGMTESFKGDLLDWIDAYVGGNLYIGASVPLRNDFWRRVEAVPGVMAATPLRYFEVQWRDPSNADQTFMFMAIDPQRYGQVTHFVFSDPGVDRDQVMSQLSAGGAVLASSVIAERYGLKVGDVLRLRTSDGSREFTIAGLVVDFYNQGLTLTGNWDDMHRYFKIDDASTILVKLANGADVGAVRQHIDALYGKRNKLTMISNDAIKQQIDVLLGQAFSLFDLLAVIAIAIASLGVINTLSMNVMERTQEIGMLRSIGMTREQVGAMILAEAGLIGLAGGVLGLVFGGLLSRIFLAAMNAMSGYRLTFSMPIEGAVLSLAAALVISQLAALVPAMQAARVAVLEAIHYE